MNFRSKLAIKCAKGTSSLIKKMGRGSGATLPGLIARKIDPNIMSEMTNMVRNKVIVTMGTNGKTTTNAVMARALKNEGYKIITNNTGANMYNGILSAFVLAANKKGLIDCDYACIEVDEKASLGVLPDLKPDFAVLTNISKDQMDRLGGIDETFDIIKKAYSSVPGTTLVLNCDDAISYALKDSLDNKVVTYGINEEIFKDLSHSEVEESIFCRFCGSRIEYNFHHYGLLGDYHCSNCDYKRPEPDYTVSNIRENDEFYDFDVEGNTVHSQIRTSYNIYNTLAAYTSMKAMGATTLKFKESIEGFDYGNNRENIYTINGKRFQLHLAKNPIGFQQKISYVLKDNKEKDIVILVNDYPQDGEDVSWIWGVDFHYLKDSNARSITTAGTRYGDLGLRFKYEDIPFKTTTNVKATIEDLLKNGSDNIYLLVNYSGLFPVNDILKALKEKEEGGNK